MDWPPDLAETLGPGRMGAPLGSGVYRAQAGGAQIVVKITEAARDEAAGLERLGRVDTGPRVPGVVYCSDTVLVIEWIPGGHRAPVAEERLGRALAGLHATAEDSWGGGSSWIGASPVNSPSPSRVRRRLPTAGA